MTIFPEYKGYRGSVETSMEDRCLYGKILFIRPTITYEGSTIDELESAFHAAVDAYLASCAEDGYAPEPSMSGTFNVRIGPDLHRDVAMAALRADVSLNGYVKQALADSLTDQKPQRHEHHHTVAVQFQATEQRLTLSREPQWTNQVSLISNHSH